MNKFRAVWATMVLVVAAALVLVPPALAQVQDSFTVSDIAGTYDVTGRGPDGRTYSGVMTLSESDGNAVLEWVVDAQGYRGEGHIVGNVLVVDWGANHPMVYSVSKDGVLAATWDDGRASERATPR